MKWTACFVACALAGLSAQTPARDGGVAPPSVTGTAAIGGLVRDDEGHPVRRATVSIDRDNRFDRATITDDAGRFGFAGLPAGRYTVTATKPSYPSISYGARTPYRSGAGLLLAEGQQAGNVVLTLVRGAVITGTVFDDQGLPMPGVNVTPWEVRTSLSGQHTLDTLPTERQWVTSDDQGRYRFYGLPPGEYTVGTSVFYFGSGGDVRVPTDAEIEGIFSTTTAPGLAETVRAQRAATRAPGYNYTKVFYPSVIDPLSAATFRLAPGDERDGIDLHMQFRPMSKIEVTVLGPDGPITARIAVETRSPVRALGSTAVSGTDPSGRYTTTSLAPGDYTVRAGVAAASGQPALSATADVTITGAEPVPVTLRLEPGMTIRGRVVFDSSGPAPTDLTTVSVQLRRETSDFLSPTQPVIADAAGAFSIDGVAPGRYVLSASVARTSWTTRSVTSETEDLTDIPIDLRPGGPSNFVITMSMEKAEISGTLTNASGQPVTDYFLILLPADRRQWVVLSRRIATTRPDLNGHFVFGNLPSGEYRIAATTDLVEHDLQDATALEGLLPASAAVSVAVGEKKTLDIKVGGQ